MKINKSIVVHNGATPTIHKVWNVEISGDGRFSAIVDSFLDEYSTAIVWRDRYPLPEVIIPIEDPYLAIVNSLIGDSSGTFYQGTIVE